jgi:hypothetical protein
VFRSHDATPTEPLSARERFTVAHELGHCVVETRFGLRPTSRREYWQLEHICNEFAATLLAPPQLLQDLLREPPKTALGALAMVQELRRRTLLSFEAASRRMVAATCSHMAIGCFAYDTKPRVEGCLRWLSESREWMGSGRNRDIPREHPFAVVLDVARELEPGSVERVQIAGTSSACVLKGQQGGIYLIALLQ